jgi:putative hydrolase of the HAD superfamily
MTGIDVVIFDLGNVLIRVDEAKSAARFAAATGKTPAEVLRYFTATPHATELALGKITSRQFYRTVAHDMGFTGSFEELAHIWNDIFSPMEPMIVLAKELATRRPRILLSNTNVLHMEWFMREYPWLAEFDALLFSHELGLLKPNRAIYDVAVQRAGLPAARCLFIDDLSANVDGARQAGLQAVQFESAEQIRGVLTAAGVLTI